MKKIDIAVVDYGMGNLRSVSKALEHVAPNKNVLVTSNPVDIENAERIVFPGQGAMPDCIRELDVRGLRDSVMHAASNKPFLGICIGLQMLFEHSEEGDVAGLGLFKGNVKRFATTEMHDANDEKLKVPHMGWNQVYQSKNPQAHALWDKIEDGARFYYVHSYYVQPDDAGVVSGYSEYPKAFISAILRITCLQYSFTQKKVQWQACKC
jgi:glutamine amidotransferase